MAKGIVRKIDELGRITIPIEYRRAASIEVLESLDQHMEDNVIHLKKGKGRKLDELGRYTIPMECRRTLGFVDRQEVDIFIECGEICIQKIGCAWCSNTDDLLLINGHQLCRKCALAVFDAVAEV